MADFGATELDAFAAEARDWLAANYPAELRDPKIRTEPEASWGGRPFDGSSDPQIVWIGNAPTADELANLHHEAHELCYIANSIKSEVVVKGVSS